MQQVALVIRKDGTVPIDEGHPHRDAIIAAIRSEGHEIEYTIEGHPKIKGWNVQS